MSHGPFEMSLDKQVFLTQNMLTDIIQLRAGYVIFLFGETETEK